MTDRQTVKPTDDEFGGFYMRHVVPIFFTFEKGDDSVSAVMTAFVLSIGQQWFLVTAGHCIDEVERITTERRYQMARCYLIDSMGLGAEHPEPIPFTYSRSYPIRLGESPSFDYGAIVLSAYYRELLEKNNVQALTEEAWKCSPSNPSCHLLVGIPAELVKVESERIELEPILYFVEAVADRPPGFSETETPLFYGRIPTDERLSSIKGMSGGPIFAFQQDPQGELRYWLVALLSKWVEKSRSIAGCPTRTLGDVLEEILRQYRVHLGDA